MAQQILIRRDTAVNWQSSNPILASGEMGFDLTNLALKIGNGMSTWSNLGVINSAGAVPVRVADSDTLDLSRTISNGGTATPPIVGQVVHITIPRTFTPLNAVPNGYFVGDYVLAATLNFGSGFIVSGHTPVIGDQIHLEVANLGGVNFAISTLIQTVNVNKPIFQTPQIVSADPTHMSWAITSSGVVSLTGTNASIHVTKNGSPIVVNAPAIVGNILYVTLPGPAVYGDVYAANLDAGLATDDSGNVSNAVGVVTANNGVPIGVPAAPVITAGTSTSTQLTGTIAAGTGSTPVTTYQLYYKKVTDSAYTGPIAVPYNGTNTPYAIGSLPADGASYDLEAYAQNGGGLSPLSNVVVKAVLSTGVTDSFTGADGTAIVGKLTETGNKTWIAAINNSVSPIIQSNASHEPDPYNTGCIVVPVTNLDGVTSALCGYNTGLIVQSDNNYTELNFTLDSGVPHLVRRFAAGNRDVYLASAALSTFPATLSLEMGNSAAGTAAVTCIAKVNGTVVYSGTPYAADSYDRGIGNYNGIMHIGQSDVDNFSTQS